ncbi:helix-turn-helix domain-containing protein [Mycolicibacterium diernhoferi]|uniref:IclR family transcriptional regulator n=2 Tax=Mycolicibacterium diernhoferi TaxID=1801 RepID=A0A1Q4H797_9MYCO|nr:helix-turn-helix domain-containing protein [Mycolicibacterium diernhoferi]OJZ63424.1 hypothetical protein BRW64_22735 [Mycolicibacterium diernhoferi]OPE54975.1 hypothetical protein BV510_07440 [Mycolicibacterium diernhoferi]PEG53996.1 IclR family transcriptional regulator [Mycolicibacterium diernhoferi]
MNAKLGPPRDAGQDPSPPTRRVVAIVELLAAAAPEPLTLAEICRDLRISRSTGHAILATLCACDWVLRDPLSGRYALGGGMPRANPASVPMSRLLREPMRRLCSTLGVAVCLSEVRDGAIVVVESIAPDAGRPLVQAGQQLPFVAPFGREFVAWAPATARRRWLDAAGPVNDVFHARIPQVLNELQVRGYGIERLSDPLLKVYTALLALDGGNVADPVAVRLAGAVADLTIVDFLPGELAQIDQSPLATISAPIFSGEGNVVMSVSAQAYSRLTLEQVRSTGDRLIEFAEEASSLIAQHVLFIGDSPNADIG